MYKKISFVALLWSFQIFSADSINLNSNNKFLNTNYIVSRYLDRKSKNSSYDPKLEEMQLILKVIEAQAQYKNNLFIYLKHERTLSQKKRKIAKTFNQTPHARNL